jgi:hypothetical protein
MHDESIGHPIDLVLVRIMYLEKEEEEVRWMTESSFDWYSVRRCVETFRCVCVCPRFYFLSVRTDYRYILLSYCL